MPQQYSKDQYGNVTSVVTFDEPAAMTMQDLVFQKGRWVCSVCRKSVNDSILNYYGKEGRYGIVFVCHGSYSGEIFFPLCQLNSTSYANEVNLWLNQIIPFGSIKKLTPFPKSPRDRTPQGWAEEQFKLPAGLEEDLRKYEINSAEQEKMKERAMRSMFRMMGMDTLDKYTYAEDRPPQWSSRSNMLEGGFDSALRTIGDTRIWQCRLCERPVKYADVVRDYARRTFTLRLECHNRIETYQIPERRGDPEMVLRDIRPFQKDRDLLDGRIAPQPVKVEPPAPTVTVSSQRVIRLR